MRRKTDGGAESVADAIIDQMRLSDCEMTLGEPPDGQASGIADRHGLAAALNSRAVRTAGGGRWRVSNVRNLLQRAAL